MNRRDAVSAFASLSVATLDAMAQQPSKAVRVAFLYFGSRQAAIDTGRYEAFRKGMVELGYVEGKNLTVEARYADSSMQRVDELVAELMRIKPDVIVATGSPTYRALLEAKSAIPVVVTVTIDPVAERLAKTVARPGGYFTGLTDTAQLLGPKQLELTVAANPRIPRVAVLQSPDNTSHPLQVAEVVAEGRRIGKQVQPYSARTVNELASGFELMARDRVDAVIVLSDTFFTGELRTIASLALRHRLPASYSLPSFADGGGLLAYGADLTDNFRRAAGYVDRIVKGARPGDLPM